MKKGYKRLLIFEIILITLLIINSFVSSILGAYGIVLFLIISLIIFKFIFGFEKQHHRYTTDIVYEMIIICLIYLIIYYLLGIFIGFAKNTIYYNLYGIFKFALPAVLTIIIKEIFRYHFLKKAQGSKLMIGLSVILFVLIDCMEPAINNGFKTKYDIFMLVALTLIPSISTNIACTYISPKVGYKPIILYRLIIQLVLFFAPIIPNLNEYLTSIVGLILPALIAYRIYLFFQKASDEEIESRPKKLNIIPIIISAIFVIVTIYFTSGYFRYYALAIASGSMQPNIKKGDVAIVEKIYDKYDELKVGQIIAFKHKDVVVVHRLINIVEDGNDFYFYTQGDANDSPDNYPIRPEMIIGTVDKKIPYIGIPTVWLNEL